MSRLRGNRPGFALPMSILVLVFLTVGVATAFTRVQSEMRRTQDRQTDTDAFAYAQSGMENFAANRWYLGFKANPPLVTESLRIAMPGGYADVVTRRVRPKTANTMAVYLMTSKGVRTSGSLAWMPQSEQVVSQYAFYREGSIKILSAWTSLSGLSKNGGAGSITGYDNCGAQPPVAGVATPTGQYSQNPTPPPYVPQGNPPVFEMGTQAQANTTVGIDWNGIINQGLIIPDYILPTPDTWPPPSVFNTDWPVVRVSGDFVLPTDGRGTLIVTGNLTINGSETWEGVVLVGGTIYANGNNNVLGAVISGLNEQLGINVPASDIGNGTKTYVYDSCAVANAVAKYGALVLIGKTWSDNWPIW